MATDKQMDKFDMNLLLSDQCNSVDISFSIQPKPDPELEIYFYEPFEVGGVVTNKSGYMSLQLHADVPYETVCARCLKPIRKKQSILLEKTVAVKGTLENEDSDDIVDDYLLIEDGLLDVVSPLFEQLMLVLPSKSLCKEDCAGLCSKCGWDLNDGNCACPEQEPDPRLACLSILLDDEKDNK